jgi:hypothetical protein
VRDAGHLPAFLCCIAVRLQDSLSPGAGGAQNSLSGMLALCLQLRVVLLYGCRTACHLVLVLVLAVVLTTVCWHFVCCCVL